MKTHAFGKIRSAHGIRGEVYLISFSKNFDWIENLDQLRLVRRWKDSQGQAKEEILNYPIKKKKPHKVGYIIKLDGIENRNQAEALSGYVLEDSVENMRQNEEYFLFELKGFQVLSQGRPLGKVEDFAKVKDQDFLVLAVEDKKLEIPHIPNFIKEVNFEKQEIQVNLPEGYDEFIQ